MKATKLVSIFAAAAVLISSAFCAQAASATATASPAASGVYQVKKMPYSFNATAAGTITVKGANNQNSAYKIARGTKVCVTNVLKLKGTVLYESVYQSGNQYIHGYLSAGTLNFRYNHWYTSINRQPVYSLNGKTRVAYLNKGQKATMLYMVGKKCAVLFDTASGRNTGIGLVNYKGHTL